MKYNYNKTKSKSLIKTISIITKNCIFEYDNQSSLLYSFQIFKRKKHFFSTLIVGANIIKDAIYIIDIYFDQNYKRIYSGIKRLEF